MLIFPTARYFAKSVYQHDDWQRRHSPRTAGRAMQLCNELIHGQRRLNFDRHAARVSIGFLLLRQASAAASALRQLNARFAAIKLQSKKRARSHSRLEVGLQ